MSRYLSIYLYLYIYLSVYLILYPGILYWYIYPSIDIIPVSMYPGIIYWYIYPSIDINPVSMYPGIPELPFGNSQVPGVNLYFKVNLLYAVIIKGTVDNFKWASTLHRYPLNLYLSNNVEDIVVFLGGNCVIEHNISLARTLV